jgi:hypothetical protein
MLNIGYIHDIWGHYLKVFEVPYSCKSFNLTNIIFISLWLTGNVDKFDCRQCLVGKCKWCSTIDWWTKVMFSSTWCHGFLWSGVFSILEGWGPTYKLHEASWRLKDALYTIQAGGWRWYSPNEPWCL